MTMQQRYTLMLACMLSRVSMAQCVYEVCCIDASCPPSTQMLTALSREVLVLCMAGEELITAAYLLSHTVSCTLWLYS
jgi:hypothetical protein